MGKKSRNPAKKKAKQEELKQRELAVKRAEIEKNVAAARAKQAEEEAKKETQQEDNVMNNIASLLEAYYRELAITELNRMVDEHGGVQEGNEKPRVEEGEIDEAAALQIGADLEGAGEEGNQVLQTLMDYLSAGRILSFGEGVNLPSIIDIVVQSDANRAREQGFARDLLQRILEAREQQEDADNVTVEEGLTLTPETGAIIVHPLVQEDAFRLRLEEIVNNLPQILEQIRVHQGAEEDVVWVEEEAIDNTVDEYDIVEGNNVLNPQDVITQLNNQASGGGIIETIGSLFGWGGGSS
ncbi:MAG: hypothetical protein N4A31_04340 [Rickettsiales bacterium]|jgi:hypothetical protein|nr:hypothetical protein [Rickettsiales bacterium]